MPADEWTDEDFVPTASAGRWADVTDPLVRYEFLLRLIRYLLRRGISFTTIEDALIGAGVPRRPAERLVEQVAQTVGGRLRPPDGPPEVEATEAVLRALGVPEAGATPIAGSLLAIADGTDAAPEFAFAGEAAAATNAALTRDRRGRGSKLALWVLAGVILAAVAVLGVLALI